MTITISDRKGVVSVHAGLASYDKLRDYPIIKTTEPYHKGDSCVREQKHFAAPDVLAFTSWSAEGPAPDVIERAAGGLVAECVLESGFGNGYVAVYRDNKWSGMYVLETQADLPDGLMGRYSSLSKLWATLGAYAEDVERNRQRQEDSKPQVTEEEEAGQTPEGRGGASEYQSGRVMRTWTFYQPRAERCVCCGEGTPCVTFNGYSSLRYEYCLECLKQHELGPFRAYSPSPFYLDKSGEYHANT